MRVLSQAADPVTLEIPTQGILFNPDLEAIDVRVWAAISWSVRAGLDRPSQSYIAELAQIHRNTLAGSLDRLAGAGKLSVDTSATPHLYQIPA